ncbi:peroxisomal membrane protein 11A [Spea bombifrons]|uniref:peroxisomal membrane protein 11A n=1 Tax=Spea bombifrons TaxID=233779 RepID=UPI00234AF426|nr:peroxisomal membrane protein 11A [Spea bombifrons]
MDSFVKFTNQSQGRDRIFRATQYACMLLRYLLENKPGKEKEVLKLKRVESSMSSGRKLFRLGNMVHAIEASRASMKISDSFRCYCLTAANVNRFFYFTCDTILWARSVGLVSGINKEKWRTRAAQCYYYSLLLNLARDLYEILQCMDKESKERKCLDKEVDSGNGPNPHISTSLLKSLENFLVMFCLSLKENPPVLLDTVKNVCDLLSPLDRLQIYQTNQGVIGLCGLMSSIVGILTLAKPILKLKH